MLSIMENLHSMESALITSSADNITNPANFTQLYSNQGYGLEENSTTQSQLTSAYGYIEQAGNTSLYKTWNGEYYAIKDYVWNSIQFADDSGWSIVGAEEVNNLNQIVSENSFSGAFYKWELDSDWNVVTADWLTGSSIHQAESDFDQDFDGDSVIGRPYTNV